ncbi:MAG: metallophosphoesterase, partial [Myxococcales bacterium]|nr:metallophosphoesterase [Myxococcales bacterium]
PRGGVRRRSCYPWRMRVAHCSDLHLLSHDGARWLQLANKRWIGAVELLASRSRRHHVAAFEHMVDDMNAQGVDHVLCTGDITNLGLEQEFWFARARFDRLARGPEHVTVIPGNHDAYVAEGVAHFARVFDEYHRSDPDWRWTAADRQVDDPGDDLRWPVVRVRGPLALVGVTTSRETPWFAAYGRAGAGQLARLQRALVDPRLAGRVRMVAIHHPPAGRRAKSSIRGLRDHAAFARVIATAGAELIVHGHEHKDLVDALAGPAGDVPVRGIASGTYHHRSSDRSARYRIFELAGDALAGASTRVWNRAQGRFEGASGRSSRAS